MKKLITLIALLLPISTFALGLITDFEWLEPNNKVEVVIGEPYQLQFSSSDNSLVFTSAYADSWVHIDFTGGQHVVDPPTGYSIDEKGVITGIAAGSYALHPTGWVQTKSGVDKWLYITVVSERSEKESNNTLDTANDIKTKIRFGLYNTSDLDYFRFTNSNLKWGDYVTFKIHYYGSRENPFGYKWATFCGGDMVGGGSLMSQDQECQALVTSGNTVYLEVYYDQSRSQYFNYGEEFVAEVFINGIPASEYGNDKPDDQPNIINGHEYVDLGLPSGKLWAKTNYGASSEGDYGIYIDWTSRNIIQSVWGNEWSTPTHSDFLELYNQCTFTWDYNANSVYGCRVTGPNGNSIFLPAAGFKIQGTSQMVGSDIYYWSDNEFESGFAYALQGSAGGGISVYQTWNIEYAMFPIRPIANNNGSNGEDEKTHDFVDLALPSGLLWATTNVGANRPEECGSFFAWGETKPKSEYSWATYKYANGSETTLTKYCNDSSYGNVDYKEVLEEQDDAATANWGKPWRTPTLGETQELINYCSWTLTTQNGISGYKVIGANGNSIFLPAGGVMQYDWSYFTERSVVMSATTFQYCTSASVLNCQDGAPYWWYGWSRCWGYNVRPVSSVNPSGILIPAVDSSEEVIGIYDLQGHKLDDFGKGINIIKYKNGSSKKVVR